MNHFEFRPTDEYQKDEFVAFKLSDEGSFITGKIDTIIKRTKQGSVKIYGINGIDIQPNRNTKFEIPAKDLRKVGYVKIEVFTHTKFADTPSFLEIPLADFSQIMTSAALYNYDRREEASIINVNLIKDGDVEQKISKAKESFRYANEQLDKINKIESIWK